MPDFSALPVLPQHIAIIMDGNNRWAKGRMLRGVSGHKAGVKSLRTTVEHCARLGIEAVTLYAFSSENWRRPQDEVSALMDLFSWALTKEVDRLVEHNLRLRVIGDTTGFTSSIQESIARAEALTAHCTGMWINVAANYGGQWDITQAARAVAQQVQMGALQVNDITPDMFSTYLSLSDLPPPDLCIRTAGEQRLSNFLLWQLAYAELYFSPKLWPDFDADALFEALQAFATRERRFGGR
ncbi:polyprenyl diphosphate synthase [Salinispirillum marinum]|uniref:Ditrans,polycis-undecaprenyl-diphosphate synthase ((2E,6E)-farnesyl-diphosphate specific) n=2 Tax=Saccharospirillaceae TaxID=255527 RepID=A0ABV8BF70_9GAMM